MKLVILVQHLNVPFWEKKGLAPPRTLGWQFDLDTDLGRNVAVAGCAELRHSQPQPCQGQCPICETVWWLGKGILFTDKHLALCPDCSRRVSEIHLRHHSGPPKTRGQ